ncbi:hypothetical protein J6590_061771 [Homalodisca vitripennis]|nr:hypothetical protein J6590_061771 [Homalodisca vitripennis]
MRHRITDTNRSLQQILSWIIKDMLELKANVNVEIVKFLPYNFLKVGIGPRKLECRRRKKPPAFYQQHIGVPPITIPDDRDIQDDISQVTCTTLDRCFLFYETIHLSGNNSLTCHMLLVISSRKDCLWTVDLGNKCVNHKNALPPSSCSAHAKVNTTQKT